RMEIRVPVTNGRHICVPHRPGKTADAADRPEAPQEGVNQAALRERGPDTAILQHGKIEGAVVRRIAAGSLRCTDRLKIFRRHYSPIPYQGWDGGENISRPKSRPVDHLPVDNAPRAAATAWSKKSTAALSSKGSHSMKARENFGVRANRISAACAAPFLSPE